MFFGWFNMDVGSLLWFSSFFVFFPWVLVGLHDSLRFWWFLMTFVKMTCVPLVQGKDDDDEKDGHDGRDEDDDDIHLCPSSPSLSFQAKLDSSPVSFSPFTAFNPTGT